MSNSWCKQKVSLLFARGRQTGIPVCPAGELQRHSKACLMI